MVEREHFDSQNIQKVDDQKQRSLDQKAVIEFLHETGEVNEWLNTQEPLSAKPAHNQTFGNKARCDVFHSEDQNRELVVSQKQVLEHPAQLTCFNPVCPHCNVDFSGLASNKIECLKHFEKKSLKHEFVNGESGPSNTKPVNGNDKPDPVVITPVDNDSSDNSPVIKTDKISFERI